MTNPIKFNPGQTLSDHAPQTFTVEGISDILSWDILNRCEVGENFNNGFNHTETIAEYKERLELIAKKISTLVSDTFTI